MALPDRGKGFSDNNPHDELGISFVKLVIVESPAKAQTISRFLDDSYEVVASYGHIRDLPGSAEEIPAAYKGKEWARMAVDVENDFAPIYVVTRESKQRIAELKRLLKDADEVVLATDEDREGESISWHLLETLKPKVPIKRIAFHEITEEAIKEALANPRDVNQDLVRAQEGRRVLDRLFGYSLSPVLWKKVRPKLSAGRVQSVAVRLVVEREEERKRFKRSEYWSIKANLSKDDTPFAASVVSWDGKRPALGKDFDELTGALKTDAKSTREVVHLDETLAKALAGQLKAGLPWKVVRVEQKETKQRPVPPFITSTLQQAASSVLGMSPQVTMRVAQRLYEGIGSGTEREGLITYMRTDSVTLAQKAMHEAASVIKSIYGEEYHTGTRQYSNKSRNAQEAHEAIRPTHFSRHPDSMSKHLKGEELSLYRLIWNRAMASQMADAVLLKTVVDIAATTDGKEVTLRANGSVVAFAGYLRVADTAQKDNVLPAVAEGERVTADATGIHCVGIEPNDHITQPPGRFTEASLVARLEEEGIGRPSTYAPTIGTIQNRGYVERQGKVLIPTYLAIATTTLLRDHFQEYVDLGFTARMEEILDNISNGEQNSVDFLRGFYLGNGDFGHGLEPQIAAELPRIEFPAIPVGADTETGEEIVVRLGRNAPFVQRGDGDSKATASIPVDLLWEDLTPEKAAELLRDKAKGNESIGQHPETGEDIFTLIGPYGPYVQLGERTDENKKPKRASLPKGADLSDVTVAMAVKLLSLPRDLGKHPESGLKVTTAIGRFGPYVKCGDEFRSLEKEVDDVYTISSERALELLAQPKKSRRSTKTVLKTLAAATDTEKAVEVCEGRYGPYVTDGSYNASLPKDVAPDDLTMDQAKVLLEAAAERKPNKRKAASKKKAATKKKAVKKKPAKKKAAKKKAAAEKRASS